MATSARTTGKHPAIPLEFVELAASVHHLSIAVDALLEEVKQDRDARTDLRVKLAVLDSAFVALKDAFEGLRRDLGRDPASSITGSKASRRQAVAVAAGGAGLGAGSITLWELVQRLLGG
jgi:hypothetical protein